MKKRRPTVPISDWRISLNLEESAKVQNHEANPAYNCKCESCEYWRKAHKNILPESLLNELIRLGINLSTPADVYEFGEDENGKEFRVIFHVVGKIMNGPESALFNEQAGRPLLHYKILRDEPYLSIAVMASSESYDASPEYEKNSEGDLLTVDMRLTIPEYSC